MATMGNRILPIREDWYVEGRVVNGQPAPWGEYSDGATRYRAGYAEFAQTTIYFEEVQVPDRPGVPFYAQIPGSKINAPGGEIVQNVAIADIPRLRNYYESKA